MANKYFTFMVVPERSSRVKKWIIPTRAVRWAVALVVFLFVIGITTSVITLRYFARHGEFEQALLKNQYLEGQLQSLQGKLSASNSTLVRVQNFEQKLRTLADIDTQSPNSGIGPLSEEEHTAMESMGIGGSETLVASLDPKVPGELGYRMRSLEMAVEDLHRRATLQEQSLQETYELLKDQETMLASKPSILPAKGWQTSKFGYRISPFTGLRTLHAGVDIAAPIGTPVNSTADGIVTHVGTDPSYGKVVVINHGYGIVTRYAHNSEILVKLGQRVKRGEKIALVGNTGRSTAPHVHYEVRLNGIPVNPQKYILN